MAEGGEDLERKARPEDRELCRQTGNRRSEGHGKRGNRDREQKQERETGRERGDESEGDEKRAPNVAA